MERQVSEFIRHAAKTQARVADILAAEQPLTDHAASLIGALTGLPGETVEERQERAMALTKNLSVYLSSLAELELALADQMEIILREWNNQEE
ncbi:hypothetical protein [Gorillibacterium sp. sgz500922]|uniref:hypothetical protein n=1 Tax=Gorillibacterium sp. sgz500922 TaxID=3446694 RepID=UPI003F673518